MTNFIEGAVLMFLLVLGWLYVYPGLQKCPECGKLMEKVDGWDKLHCPECKYTINL